MRIRNSVRNIFFGLTGQLVSVLMGFLFRTVFIYKLGVDYLGIDGLFTSILLMLSLANLGFDTAMVYSLYKPLAEKDLSKIQALMNLFKQAYRIIGLIVLIIGLLIMPFLPSLISSENEIDNLNIIYLLFLINSVSSYYFVYYHSIIIADQRTFIISKIHSLFIIVSQVSQIVFLMVLPIYILILIIQIAFRIVENIYIAKKSKELYPYLKDVEKKSLSKNEKIAFFKNLYALFLYKVSGVVINGTDNIIIAKFLGLKWVGMYSNYLLIIFTIETFLSYIFNSVKASIGNVNVSENDEMKFFIFKVLHFLNFWFYGLVTVVLINLLNPLMNLWLGPNYVFNELIVIAILLNFITSGMQTACTTFRETSGIFIKGKYTPIIAAFVNLAVSIILVQLIGFIGVLLGTVISRVVTYFWFDPFILHKYIFNKSVSRYFFRYFSYFFVIIFAAYTTRLISQHIWIANLYVEFIVLGLCSFIMVNLIFFVFYSRSEEFRYLLKVFTRIRNMKILSNFKSIKEYY
jgi:O-antigen/teichoic acid export membrane protein